MKQHISIIVLLLFMLSVSEVSLKGASELRNVGRIEEALIIYDSLIQINSKDSDALIARGFCRLAVSRVEEAYADFKTAIDISSDYVDGYIGMALAAKRMNHFELVDSLIALAINTCNSDKSKLLTLQNQLWEVGFYSQARKLSAVFAAEGNRVCYLKVNSAFVALGYDLIDNGGNWRAIEGGALLGVRPDWSLGAVAGSYERNGIINSRLSLSPSYRHTYRLSGAYELSVAYPERFLPSISQKILLSYLVRANIVAEVGVTAAKYDNGWVRLGIIGSEFNHHAASIRYQLSAGLDNNNDNIMTQMAAIGYAVSQKSKITIGGAIGSETVDKLAYIASEKVASIYSVVAFPLFFRVGMVVSLAEEWRDKNPFRTTFSLSIIYR